MSRMNGVVEVDAGQDREHVGLQERDQQFEGVQRDRERQRQHTADPAERAKLDEVEGVGDGYEHSIVTVINEKGRRQKVLAYLAATEYIDDSLNPSGKYKDQVLAGASEHGLPSEYVTRYIQPVEAAAKSTR